MGLLAPRQQLRKNDVAAGERALGTERSGRSGAPTSATLLADQTVHALAGLDPGGPAESLADRGGTYNLTCSGEASWCGFAEEVFSQARGLGWPLQVLEVKGIPTSAYPTPAQRPLNSRLDCSRFCEQFATTLPSWQDCLGQTLQRLAIL